MSRIHDEQVIALAGLFQAAALVEQIARRGMVPQNNFESSIASLFMLQPDMTEDVFGGVKDLPINLSLGLRQLQDLVEKKRSDNNPDIMRYALSAIYLERKLSARPDMLQILAERLQALEQKAHYFSQESQTNSINPSAYTHPNVVAGIAQLYQDTLSTFSFRIQVGGDPRHLQNPDNAAKIRALLLAAVRAAILWRQVGGKRWHLFFFKSRVRPSLRRILGKG
ncbi:high frequency lysogenization protein HflD [Nitrincola tapanii]|uniref:High frequency lysogenization protein HflD homolog n=1 Tax=Nitrincola tapanii TaxID=1708751 RepID=A0A5A9W3Q4_9GAMM|nr:high frequency lysogenization protein HflD [Nitrincola tapanii]KAA0875386.1 lysogenization regulator HflD [Nitrincola tapanii]